MAENNSGKRIVSKEGNKKYKRKYASELDSEKFRKETGDTIEESVMRAKKGIHTQKDQNAEYNEKIAKYGSATAGKPKYTAQSVNLGTSDNPFYLVRQVYQQATPIGSRKIYNDYVNSFEEARLAPDSDFVLRPYSDFKVTADGTVLDATKVTEKDGSVRDATKEDFGPAAITKDVYGLVGVQFVIDSSKKPMNKQQIRLTQTNLGKQFLNEYGEKMKVDSAELAAAWCESVKDVDATNESGNLPIYYINKDIIENPDVAEAASKIAGKEIRPKRLDSHEMTEDQYISYVKAKREGVLDKAKAAREDIADATFKNLTLDEATKNAQIIGKPKKVSNEEKLQHMNDAFFRELQKNNSDYNKLEHLENSMSKFGKTATGEDTSKLIGNNYAESNKAFMSVLQGGNGTDRLLHKLIKGGIKTQSGESLYDAAFNSYPVNVGSNSEKNAWIRQNVPAEVLANAYKKAAAHTDDAKANANNKKAQNEKKSKGKDNSHIVDALTPKYSY